MTMQDSRQRETDGPLLVGICLAAFAATIALVWMGSRAYATVLGIPSPVGPVIAVLVLGFAGWRLVSRRSWIPARTAGLAGYRHALLIGLALPIPVIVMDGFGGFGQNINAPAPGSLLFYPSVAVVAEFVFHIGPLALAAALAHLWGRAARILLFCGLGVAVVIEPALQVALGAQGSAVWVRAGVGVQLLLFNVVGMVLLRRFGILRVLAYRLSYYLVWHVLWGHARLNLLFTA